MAGEGAFWTYLSGFILVALFGMLILSTVIEVGGEYDMDTSKVVGGATSLSKFNNSISDVETQAQSMKKTFEEGSIWAIGGVVVTGIFGITYTMITLIFSPFTLLKDIAENMFDVPVYVTAVVFGLLIFGLIFAIWRLIKIGD